MSKRYIRVFRLKKKLRDKINGTCKTESSAASAKTQHLNADLRGWQTKSLFVLLCQASILLPTFFSIQCFRDGIFFIATLCCCWISFFYTLLWNILWKPLNMTCAEFQRVNLCGKCESVISESSSHPNFCNLCRIIGVVYNMFVWIV